MQFHENSRVILNGDEMGHLARVVVDPRTMRISDLVVRRGGLSPEEKIVPVSLVESALEDEIVLKSFPGGWSDLQNYREVGYRTVDEEDLIRAGNLERYSTPIMFAYPPAIPITGATYPLPGLVGNDASILGTGIEDGYQKVERVNIPEGNVVIQPGTIVLSVEKEKLGSVERVLTSEESRSISHLVIVNGTLFKERKLIPVNWIDQVDQDSVQLGVSARFIGRLPEFEGD